MSDLQCPATLLVSRPGDSEYAVAGVLSVDGGRLTVKGREQVGRLAAQVRSRRVAAVYSSRMERAVESAELAASQLGLQCIAVDGLQELAAGELAGAVLKRFTKAVEEMADTHRGETVLVFTHGGALSLAIPTLSVNLRYDAGVQRCLPNCAPVEVEVDADGWRVVTWPGATDQLMDQAILTDSEQA